MNKFSTKNPLDFFDHLTANGFRDVLRRSITYKKFKKHFLCITFIILHTEIIIPIKTGSFQSCDMFGLFVCIKNKFIAEKASNTVQWTACFFDPFPIYFTNETDFSS